MNYPKLKNYTTTISAERSIGEIEQMLLNFGANNFMKKVSEDGKRQYSTIMFTIEINGNNLPFRLPANIDKVTEYLWQDYKNTRTRYRKTREDFAKEAYNITWRIIKDWVHAQLSIIATGMVKIEEVFLPYLMVDDKTTLSEKFVSGGLKKLLPEYKPFTDGE